jgi:hypothetical protein
MDPPSTFTLTLRPYQKQALSWMSNLETGSESGREGSIHPLWQQWKFNLSPQEMQGADGAMLDVDEFPERERAATPFPRRHRVDPPSPTFAGQLNASTTTRTPARCRSTRQRRMPRRPAAFLPTAWEWARRCGSPRLSVSPVGASSLTVLRPGDRRMMASLIHKNRFASVKPPSSSAEGSSPVKRESSPIEEGSVAKKPRRRLHLDSTFRPIRTEVKEEGDDTEGESDHNDAGKSDDDDYRPGSEDGPHATLVVCPVSLMHQWKEELERSSKKRSLTVQSATSPLCPAHVLRDD